MTRNSPEISDAAGGCVWVGSIHQSTSSKRAPQRERACSSLARRCGPRRGHGWCSLGQSPHLVLRNHGLLIVGKSIAAAFIATYRMERACAMQVAFQQSGAAFHPINDGVVSAASDRPTGIRNEPAKFE